jgi:hypothetical protein
MVALAIGQERLNRIDIICGEATFVQNLMKPLDSTWKEIRVSLVTCCDHDVMDIKGLARKLPGNSPTREVQLHIFQNFFLKKKSYNNIKNNNNHSNFRSKNSIGCHHLSSSCLYSDPYTSRTWLSRASAEDHFANPKQFEPFRRPPIAPPKATVTPTETQTLPTHKTSRNPTTQSTTLNIQDQSHLPQGKIPVVDQPRVDLVESLPKMHRRNLEVPGVRKRRRRAAVLRAVISRTEVRTLVTVGRVQRFWKTWNMKL